MKLEGRRELADGHVVHVSVTDEGLVMVCDHGVHRLSCDDVEWMLTVCRKRLTPHGVVTHFLHPGSGVGVGACGRHTMVLTDIPDLVTCGACKGTVKYRGRLERVEAAS